MIRIAMKRTGVEILGSEHSSLMPAKPTAPWFSSLQSLGFQTLPQAGLVANPDVWVHLITAPNGEKLGNLVLCNPDPTRFQAVAALGQQAQDQVYAGFTPNTEHWQWVGLGPTDLWPASFVLRGGAYGRRPVLAGAQRVAYPMDVFGVKQPGQALFQGAETAAQRWEIHTDALPSGPIGGMARFEDGSQRWWARPDYLVNGLIPPGKKGTWQFQPEGPPPNGVAFVQLLSGALPGTALS